MWRMKNQEAEDFGLKRSSNVSGQGPGARQGENPSQLSHAQLFLSAFRAYFSSHLHSIHFYWPGDFQTAQGKCSDRAPVCPAQHQGYSTAPLAELVPQHGHEGLQKAKESPLRRQSTGATTAKIRKSPICCQFIGRTESKIFLNSSSDNFHGGAAFAQKGNCTHIT